MAWDVYSSVSEVWEHEQEVWRQEWWRKVRGRHRSMVTKGLWATLRAWTLSTTGQWLLSLSGTHAMEELFWNTEADAEAMGLDLLVEWVSSCLSPAGSWWWGLGRESGDWHVTLLSLSFCLASFERIYQEGWFMAVLLRASPAISPGHCTNPELPFSLLHHHYLPIMYSGARMPLFTRSKACIFFHDLI